MSVRIVARVSHGVLVGSVHNEYVTIWFGTNSMGGSGEIERESYLDVAGEVHSLGDVSGSFGVNEPQGLAAGSSPGLAGSTLTLSNATGSVQLDVTSSKNGVNHFSVEDGTGTYAGATGTGRIEVTYDAQTNEGVVKLKSRSS